MGNRLSKIVTKTGDQGTTGLGDGARVSKNHIRMEAIGTLDELNSHVGLLLAMPGIQEAWKKEFTDIQHRLFDIGGELCIPGYIKVTEAHVAEIEAWITHWNEQLPPLKEFILPGGNLITAQCHVVRTVARRAERTVVSVHQETPINSHTLAYINRLSDYFFVMARIMAKTQGSEETLWAHER